MKNNSPTKPTTFYCPACRTKHFGQAQFRKVARTDPEYQLVKGQEYPFCSTCLPKIKEYNEYDLLNENPHLWDKYPYADAQEILEKEFGIKLPEN